MSTTYLAYLAKPMILRSPASHFSTKFLGRFEKCYLSCGDAFWENKEAVKQYCNAKWIQYGLPFEKYQSSSSVYFFSFFKKVGSCLKTVLTVKFENIFKIDKNNMVIILISRRYITKGYKTRHITTIPGNKSLHKFATHDT